MKNWILGLLVLALCAGPAAASSIGFFVSSYSPDDTDTGEGIGIDLEFGSGPVEFELRFSLYEELVSAPIPEVYEIEAVPIDFGINRNFGRGKTVTPYIGAGLSYIVFDFNVDTTITGGAPRSIDIDPEIGYYAQVGLEFKINETWKGSAEVLYRQVDAEAEGDDLGLPRDQRITMTGPALNFGLAVQW